MKSEDLYRVTQQDTERVLKLCKLDQEDIMTKNPKRIPTKVICDITAKGYTVKVYAGDIVIAKKAMVMQSARHAKGAGKEEFDRTLPQSYLAGFVRELDSFEGFGPFNVAQELRKLAEKLDELDKTLCKR